MMEQMKNEPVFLENGSVTSPAGFQASGVACGLKKSGNPDFAMLFSEHPCNFAGTFTSNLFPAAPVQLCRERCANRETVRAVVVNSGIANACTGQTGYQGAVKMAEMTAGVLGIEPEDVLVSSTGRIGVQLPLEKIANGIRMAADALSSDGGAAASSAIITTDTRPKTTAVSFVIDGRRVTIGGMTKGAGMIAPRMLLAKPHATMLCYITTDAVIDNRTLGCWLEDAVDKSFNRITVDNDMSTNDTCLIFANGASGVKISAGNGEDLFRKSLVMVVQYLAKNMVMDGEGTTKMISVEVTGAASESDARLCAKAIADSMLCKTAWFGNDPNWGRVVAALGYSGAEFDPAKCNIYYDGTPVVRNGGDAGTPEADLLDVVKKREFVITCDFGEGDGEYWVWSSDLSHEYVTINADYHT